MPSPGLTRELDGADAGEGDGAAVEGAGLVIGCSVPPVFNVPAAFLCFNAPSRACLAGMVICPSAACCLASGAPRKASTVVGASWVWPSGIERLPLHKVENFLVEVGMGGRGR